ncbi:MAG TPA: ubiquinone/menaquinone biosynthesis methyltransferase [Aquifex aeolicus]|uniref:Demethylmenaquinone methyltransferase n=1 Tax=Aquifex aeolicus TaxID=63363 RepID=A0A9D0YQE5_AQUAO|nr:ubiquinone/menaquinone biosynthesis methyltransferase [Aquifex aeolicus]
MGKKENSVRVFDRIADRYEVIAKFFSFGILPYWFKRLLEGVERGERVLDVACGSGILFGELSKRFKIVIGLDYSLPMLLMAKKKKIARAYLVRGDALKLPFKDETFDAAVVSLGLRHFGDTESSLREIFRVLKKGGTLHILEVGIPQNPFLEKLFLSFLKGVILPIGKLLSKGEVFDHLFGSIVRFPHGEKLNKLLKEIGFERTNYESVNFGIAYIYRAKK